MPLQRDGRFSLSIDGICNHRTVQECQMYADLMRATSQRMDFQQRVISETFQSAILADGLATFIQWDHCHELAVGSVASNWSFNPPRRCGWFAVHQGQVNFLHLAGFELLLQPAMGTFVFSDDYQARSVLVEPVDNPGPFFTPNAFKFGYISEGSMNERSLLMPWRRMNHHPCRFVHHHQIRVLKNNIEWYFFSHQTAGYRWRNPDLNLLAKFQGPSRFRDRFGFHIDEPILDKPL